MHLKGELGNVSNWWAGVEYHSLVFSCVVIFLNLDGLDAFNILHYNSKVIHHINIMNVTCVLCLVLRSVNIVVLRAPIHKHTYKF
jgi:hypothetical protein